MTKRLTLAQRQANIASKIEKFQAGADAADDEEE